MARQASTRNFSITPHRGGQMLYLTVPSKTNIVQNIFGMRDHVLREIERRAQRFAADLERDMRNQHDFHDQPSNIHRRWRYEKKHAREQFFAEASRRHGDKEQIAVQFGHSADTYMLTHGGKGSTHGARKVTYGGILETGKFWKHHTGDKYATVRKTYRRRREEFRRLGQGAVKNYTGAMTKKAKSLADQVRGRR